MAKLKSYNFSFTVTFNQLNASSQYYNFVYQIVTMVRLDILLCWQKQTNENIVYMLGKQ